MARGEGRRLTYPSIPRDPTGVHARFRSLNFERSLPVSPAVIKRNSRGGVATDFAPAVDTRRRQPRRREEWAAAQFVWFKVWCFCVSTGSFCSLWPETGVGPSKRGDWFKAGVKLLGTPLEPIFGHMAPADGSPRHFGSQAFMIKKPVHRATLRGDW